MEPIANHREDNYKCLSLNVGGKVKTRVWGGDMMVDR